MAQFISELKAYRYATQQSRMADEGWAPNLAARKVTDFKS